MTVPTLQPHHLEELQASGLSDETISAARLYSATNETATMLIGFGRSGGLAFPYLRDRLAFAGHFGTPGVHAGD